MPPRSRTLEIIRTALGALEEFGIAKPPVDSLACLRQRAEVEFFPLVQVDGSTSYSKRTGKFFSVLSSKVSGARLRWTAAHELGHIYLHLPPGSRRPKTRYEEDREADRFARNFLMPEEWVRREVSILSPHGELLIARDLGRLKEIFQVSWPALLRRLDELGIQDWYVSDDQLGIEPPDVRVRLG